MQRKHSVWVKTMSCVIDLASRRPRATPPTNRRHPAGVSLPLDARDADLIAPEVHWAITSGTYCADTIRVLPEVVQAGDRVLVIGAGLGVVSTLIAKCAGVERVLALEANTALIPYLERVHALNGVPWVETLNGVPAVGRRGRTAFFARRDVRASSLLPEEGHWQQAMMVPLVDVDLILAEEAITLMVCELPTAPADILRKADLGPVQRIICGPDAALARTCEADHSTVQLGEQRFAVAEAGATLLLSRDARALELPSEGRISGRTGT